MIKSISYGFKDIDTKQGIVSGYFAHFGSIDSDGDRIIPGAFSKTIKENGPEGTQLIKHLLDHDKTKVLGKIQVLKEDSVGLYYESKIGRHTLGKDFLLMCEDLLIDQHSFGYRVIKNAKKSDANELSELAMFEGSSIQFLGANRNTPIVGVKSLDEVVDDLEALEKALRNGKYSDETFKLIEKQIQSLYEIVKPQRTSKDQEPTKSTSILDILKTVKN